MACARQAAPAFGRVRARIRVRAKARVRVAPFAGAGRAPDTVHELDGVRRDLVRVRLRVVIRSH